MKLIVLPRTVYKQTIGTKIYREVYFGNLVSSNADAESLNEWSDTGTYSYLDEVIVGALQTKYTATVDNPVGHPSTSTGWFGEGINANRMLDRHFTTQTVFSANPAVIEFGTFNMTHLVGQNIENAKTVTIEYIKADGTVDTALTATKEMYRVEDFNCDSCCNPEPVEVHHMYETLHADCETHTKVRISIEKIDTASPILIGVLSVGRAYSIGCALAGMTPELTMPKGIEEFPAIQATGVAPANIETRIRGDVMIDRNHVDDMRKLFMNHGAYLNFYVFDEVDEVQSGVVLGRFTRFATPIETANKVTVPIEVFGIIS